MTSGNEAKSTDHVTSGNEASPADLRAQYAALESQLVEATAKYNEAVASAAADAASIKRLAPLRKRTAEINGAMEDLKAVMLEIERAKERAAAAEAARRAAEERAANARAALELVTKYEAAGAELQRAVEALGATYKAFKDVGSATNSALYLCGGALDGFLARFLDDLDVILVRHLLVTAELGHLPGLDELPKVHYGSWPDPIGDTARGCAEILRRELAPQLAPPAQLAGG